MSRTSKNFLPCILAALGSCGGGGGSSSETVLGLQAPQQVTIIEAQGSSPAPARLPSGARAAGLTDYQSDATKFWVRDESMQSLDTVNSILGYLHDTNYWDPTVINKGPYLALIASDDRGGDARGSGAPSYEEWTIDSTRTSNDSPQTAKFWVKTKDDSGNAMIIYGKLEVTAEPSADNPFGVFTLYFKQLPASMPPLSTNAVFEGYLRSVARTDGLVEVEFYNREGDVTQTPAPGESAYLARAHIIGNPADDTGRAFTDVQYKENNGSLIQFSGTYNVQFDSTYLARKDLTTSTIAVLDRNNYQTYVHRYGVYDAATESRVAMHGGFPIETAAGDHGWVGYWGMWFPEGVAIANGQALTRRDYRTGTTTPYTAFIAPGRLEERVRTSLTLGDIKNEDLETFDPTLGLEVRARYTGTDLVCVATRSGNSWTPVNPPTSLASSFSTGQYVTFYSHARGSVELEWPAALSDTVPVYVWSSSTVTGNSPALAGGDLTLYGYWRMLRPGITTAQANYQGGQSPYFPDATSPTSGQQVYTFNATTLQLELGGVPVTLANGVTVTQGPGMWGFDCGPLLATALSSFGEIGTRTTTYQWYTGANDWNQLRTVKDANGNFVQFDEPIRLNYTHHEPGSAYDGRTFVLDWDGENLGGIPYEENQNTGQWYPLLNIPSGTTLAGGGSTYKVKQLEGEQFMVEMPSPASIIAARGYDLDTSISQPDAANYQDPAIGAMPVVTDPPRFVGGMPQE
ncbi:MAG: hypothetical protein Fur0037_15390 [Planctomycetota bacterium]